MLDERWKNLVNPEDELKRAHAALDDAGVSRYSGDDEMPPSADLDVPERIRRLAERIKRVES